MDSALNKTKRGVSKKPAFLAAFVATASVTKAAAAAGVERSLHYRWLLEDAEYAKAFEAAKVEAGQAIEDEAIRRAHEGIDEPLTYQGQFSYAPDAYDKKTKKLKRNAKPLTVRKYSDALLMKLLDGFLPDKYKRRASVDVTKTVTATIKVEAEKLATLTDDELAQFRALALKIEPGTEEK